MVPSSAIARFSGVCLAAGSKAMTVLRLAARAGMGARNKQAPMARREP
jgi:hypothetical protein